MDTVKQLLSVHDLSHVPVKQDIGEIGEGYVSTVHFSFRLHDTIRLFHSECRMFHSKGVYVNQLEFI